jgi:serine/threonine-protein kinase RsbW
MQSRSNPGLSPGGVTTERGPAVNDIFAPNQNVPAGDARTTVVRRFPAACVSVREARHFLLEHLRGDGNEDLASLALMLSELATNAVQHADTAFEVDITISPESQGRSVHVRVTDEAPGFPVPQTAPPDGLRGRGLCIVESLADSWGIEVQRGRTGKTVWFTSRLEPASALSPIGRPDQFGQDDEREVGITGGVSLDDRLALLEASLRAAPPGDPDTVSDFVIGAMAADQRSSDDIVVLPAQRAPTGAGGGAGSVGPHARTASEETVQL